MMVIAVMHDHQHQVLMRLLALRKTRRPPEYTTVPRPQTRVAPLDGLRKTLADQVLIIRQDGLERTPIVRAVPHDLQMFDQAVEPTDSLRVAPTPDISQDFIALRRIGIQEPTLVLLALADKRPELVDDHTIILFLHGIDHELVGLSSQATRDGLLAHAQDIGTIAEAAAASKHVQGLTLALGISALIEVLILELLAASTAEQILGPTWLCAVFDYFVREAVGAAYFGGYFAHIRKVRPAASRHTF